MLRTVKEFWLAAVYVLIFQTLTALLQFSAAATSAEEISNSANIAQAVPGELLVKFKPELTQHQARKILESHGAISARRMYVSDKRSRSPMDRWWHVRLNKNIDVRNTMEQLRQHVMVEHVEPNYRVSIQSKQ